MKICLRGGPRTGNGNVLDVAVAYGYDHGHSRITNSNWDSVVLDVTNKKVLECGIFGIMQERVTRENTLDLRCLSKKPSTSVQVAGREGTVDADGLKIGCQRVSLDEIERLARMVRSYQGNPR